MSLSIQGKTAIVTGAGRGIGLAIARHFEEAGANVMFADSDEAMLESVLGDQMTGDGPVRGFAGDLGQKLTLANLVSATIDAFDRIDILVNAHRMVQPCDPMTVGEDLLSDMLRQHLQKQAGISLELAARNAAKMLANGLQERSREVQVLAQSTPLWAQGLQSPLIEHMLLVDVGSPDDLSDIWHLGGADWLATHPSLEARIARIYGRPRSALPLQDPEKAWTNPFTAALPLAQPEP